MPELIDRNHAEQAIEAYLCSRCERNGNEVCHNCPHIDGDEILKSVPTIEAEPVRHGRWIAQEDADGDISFVCSECGRRLRWDEDFCPSCGSDMRTADTKD